MHPLTRICSPAVLLHGIDVIEPSLAPHRDAVRAASAREDALLYQATVNAYGRSAVCNPYRPGSFPAAQWSRWFLRERQDHAQAVHALRGERA